MFIMQVINKSEIKLLFLSVCLDVLVCLCVCTVCMLVFVC